MEKRVDVAEASEQLGQVIQDVEANRYFYVVERNGKGIVAVIPIDVYQQWKRRRHAFFERVRGISERTGLDEEEAEVLVEEATRAVRRRRWQ